MIRKLVSKFTTYMTSCLWNCDYFVNYIFIIIRGVFFVYLCGLFSPNVYLSCPFAQTAASITETAAAVSGLDVLVLISSRFRNVSSVINNGYQINVMI